MSQSEHEVEIATGRRDGDGHVRVSIFAADLLALTIEGHGERAPTLLLTLAQARRLQEGLAKLLSAAGAGGDEEGAAEDHANAQQQWPELERRTSGELR